MHVTGAVGRAILTVSFVRDYSTREYSWSDIRRATVLRSFARSFVPLTSVYRGLFAELTARTDRYVPVCMCALGVYPLVRLLPLPMKSHYIIEMPPSMVLNEIG